MARLIVRQGPNQGTVYDLVEDSITLGRDPFNLIQLPSEAVSRNHALIERVGQEDGEHWTIKDLNSKNGVLLNGKRTESGTLRNGNLIQLGDCALRFFDEEFESVAAEEATGPGPKLTVRDVLHRETIAAGPPALDAGATDAQKQLHALLVLSQAAGSAQSYSELFESVTRAVEENLSPHRTVPILFDERRGLVRPWVSDRGEFDQHLARIPISSTVVEYVRKNRAAILSESARKDRRLAGAKSITAHEIASAMCAPMLLGDRLLGAIYVDRLGDAEGFAKSDLKILNAVAVQTAAAIENVRIRNAMGRERYVREKEARGAYDIVGRCEPMQQMFRFIAKAAPTSAAVLIEGESGTGKELVARAIHLNSPRRHQPFEAVNCAAMAPTLLESELFGHVRGAFTGADKDRPGRFELADGGTLFLDEIGELPESSQSKLLRVLESGELRRVGDVKDRSVNVRLVAATNKRLAEEVQAGRFREDLYFRLNVLHITLPPLRERPGDIPLLAEEFLKHFAKKCGRPKLRYEDRVLRLFETHRWPGNVRELKNVVERMVVMAEGEVLTVDDVPFETRDGGADSAGEGGRFYHDGAPVTLKDLERNHIARTLKHTGGNKKEAARILGIDRSTLYAKLKLYDLD